MNSKKLTPEPLTRFFQHPFWARPTTLWGLLVLVALVAWLGKCLLTADPSNNFLIYRGVFDHLVAQQLLYGPYPGEYLDMNHYGPFFGLLVAPFALLPHDLGALCWILSMTLLLGYAIRQLPVTDNAQKFIFWFSALELLTTAQNMQFNIATAAMILLSFSAVEKGKEGWAAFWIVVGTFVKLYGIVGLAFFFFVKRKGRFIGYLALWSLLALTLPMLISSPEYVLEQYYQWFLALQNKDASNMFSPMQNVSLLGIVRKISQDPSYSDLWLIIPGLLSFAAIYLRRRQFQYASFRLFVLVATLLFLVLFSTGSESCTYIVAVLGVAIWYKTYPQQKRPWGDLLLLIVVFVLTILSATDLFPRSWRVDFVRPYALKALPCVLVYFRLIYELYFADFSRYPSPLTKKVTL